MSAKEQLRDLVDGLNEDQAADLLNTLALRAAIDEADRQIENGEFTEYDENTIQDLVEAVKRRGKERLAAERNLRTAPAIKDESSPYMTTNMNAHRASHPWSAQPRANLPLVEQS